MHTVYCVDQINVNQKLDTIIYICFTKNIFSDSQSVQLSLYLGEKASKWQFAIYFLTKY